MVFRVLGMFHISLDDRVITIRRPRNRALLSYLAFHANHPVTTDQLIEGIWGQDAPRTARAQVQADVSAIRRELTASGIGQSIVTISRGYQLSLPAKQIDHVRFSGLVAEARHEAQEAGAELLRDALKLWRGPAFADIKAAFVDPARTYLEERRLSAFERLVEIELALGRHREIIADLAETAEVYPFRERLHRLLMLALYRDGRRVEALRGMRQLRSRLAEEHGLDLSREVSELGHKILNNCPTLATST